MSSDCRFQVSQLLGFLLIPSAFSAPPGSPRRNARLAINFTHHDVERTDDSRDVGN
jgi:hypothetical protein